MEAMGWIGDGLLALWGLGLMMGSVRSAAARSGQICERGFDAGRSMSVWDCAYPRAYLECGESWEALWHLDMTPTWRNSIILYN